MRSSRFRQDSVNRLVYRRSLKLEVQQEHFRIIGHGIQDAPFTETTLSPSLPNGVPRKRSNRFAYLQSSDSMYHLNVYMIDLPQRSNPGECRDYDVAIIGGGPAGS